MDLFRQCISLKAVLLVIEGMDVKYLYLGGGGKRGTVTLEHLTTYSADEKFINY
jgi:hypothetical protein